jgi:hypothetical protein
MKKKQLPQTSKDAYASLDPSKLREIYKRILYALSQLGEATTEECAAYLKVDHVKLWKRYSELHTMGLIYRPGTKKLLKSGRSGFCWSLTSTGMPKTDHDMKALKGKPTIADYSRKLISPKPTQLDLL